MTPDALYAILMQANATTECDPFDGHILACIFAAAADECQAGGSFTNAIGIFGPTLRGNIERHFPGTLQQLDFFALDSETTVSEDERCLRELLWRFRSTSSEINSLLAILIAHRATRSKHLWQDLGLANRGELSRLMVRHFAQLARRNEQDMKWKKFFYRMICRDEGFNLCTAPCCSECSDFAHCFGDESGESLFARTRLTGILPVLTSIDSSIAS
jgi:nitrogen fixation protein NifQ